VEAGILLVDGAMASFTSGCPYGSDVSMAAAAYSRSEPLPYKQGGDQLRRQLLENLRYRRSLFQSTQLRLVSLQKRIDNAITLAFNLVAQQDSRAMQHDSELMMQESSSMRIIAAITMVFLPTTGVATILGSQLFVSSLGEDGVSWKITITPLFHVLWYFAIPLTLVVFLGASVWHWLMHDVMPLATVKKKVSSTFRFATFPPKKPVLDEVDLDRRHGQFHGSEVPAKAMNVNVIPV
jgi:hypothetical protein